MVRRGGAQNKVKRLPQNWANEVVRNAILVGVGAATKNARECYAIVVPGCGRPAVNQGAQDTKCKEGFELGKSSLQNLEIDDTNLSFQTREQITEPSLYDQVHGTGVDREC